MIIFPVRQIAKIILKKIVLLFFLLFLSSENIYLLAISKHDIVYFQGNKKGAISITFDDGYASQVTNGVPQLNVRNLKGTFFIITTSSWRGEISWATLNQIASQGHEIGSHTVDHYNLTALPKSELRWQLSGSQRSINSNVPSQSCVSFSYPGGDLNQTVKAVTSEYYFAARGVGSPEGYCLNYYEDGPNWRTVDFFNIGSYAGSDNINYSNIDIYLKAAEERHAWMDFHFHELQNGAAFSQFLDHILTRNVWIGTFGSIVRYMRERQASTIAVLSESNAEIKLILTNLLDHSVYCQPLTIRSTVPPSWTNVQVQQGEKACFVNTIIEGTDSVIYYDIVPGNGTVTLSPLGDNLSETVTTPSTLSGPASGFAGIGYTYSTGGSSSNLSHAVEYQFDWKGDGTDLSSWSSASQSKVWAAAGTYNVRARARCVTDTGTVSSWSASFGVNITPTQAPVSPLLNLNFEEGSGTSALDSSGLGNNGTISGATYTTDSAVGAYALSFAGTGTVTVPGKGSLKPDSISVAFWAKHTSDTASSYGGIIQGAYGDGYYTGFRMLDYRNQALVQMNFGDSGPIGIYGSSFIQGAWCHLVLTYNHVKIRLYQNGVLVSEIAETRNIKWDTNPTNLTIGRAQWYFKGSIDKVSMFNYALSPQEIAQLYAEKSNPVETVSAPSTPSGPASGAIGVSYAYTTAGSSSNLGHSMEYQFDWKGDGTDLSSWGSSSQSKTWTVAGSYSVRARARCITDTGTVSSWSNAVNVNITPAQVSYSVMTNPSSLKISIDGVTYTAPQTFNWNSGSLHTLSVTSPQAGTLGIQYIYNSWSDNGGQSHNITAPASATAYTASFATQYTLTTSANPSGGGTVSPSGANWENSGQAVSVSATATAGYRFVGWSGDLSGSTSPSSITMSGPKSVVANFEIITSPSTPSGPGSGIAGISYTYSTGGSSSNLGHAVEYQFDWKGDGTDLSAWGSASQTKAWTLAGSYSVRARARCVNDTGTVSTWSGSLAINIAQAQAPVSLLNLNFEEGSGNKALDSSGFGNNGTIAGATYTMDSAVGSYALSFNGNSTVTVPGNGFLKPDSISIALWVKHTSDTASSYGGIIQGAYGDGYYTGFRILDWQNQALAEINFGDSGPIWILGSSFGQGAWCHLVLTYDHAKIRLYQNGVLVREVAETRNINWHPAASNLTIGLAQWYFKGVIDKITIFNYALSPQEIAQLYNKN